jgi:hypothetical protein
MSVAVALQEDRGAILGLDSSMELGYARFVGATARSIGGAEASRYPSFAVALSQIEILTFRPQITGEDELPPFRLGEAQKIEGCKSHGGPLFARQVPARTLAGSGSAR